MDKNLTLQEHKVILARFFDFDEKKSSDTLSTDENINTSKEGSQTQITKSETAQFNKIKDFNFEKLTLHDVGFTYNNGHSVTNGVNTPQKQKTY